jgi:hypothetical protein
LESAWERALRVDPDSRYAQALLSRVFRVTPKQLQQPSVGTVLHAALFLTEGTGLLPRRSGRSI